MTLSPGAKLGPYEITAKLGEGGMGQVFRAVDRRLGRQVAIKVLPDKVARDPEHLALFEREARLLASLNHPNVAAIYGLEEGDGVRALVLELVEGPTLADRLQKGALPLAESLRVARQIAEALGEAHEKGIVHRDLKPGNVKCPEGGRVKVLDFGLAKAYRGEEADPSGPSDRSKTLALGETQEGVIVGTAAYMAPEQARAQRVDRRADIWAFGVVLYEMLTGARLFHADTSIDTLTRVLTLDPDWSALPEETPAAIRRLLRRCLERDVRNRLHDIADARLVIEDVLAGRDVPAAGEDSASPTRRLAPPAEAARRPTRLGLLLTAAVALAVVTAVALVWIQRAGRTDETASGAVAAERRIAVLPFENLGAPEDAYFADGMTDEVRTRLTGLAGLAVIASASANQYRGTNQPLEEVAEELGVRHLLLAKVRWQKSGSSSRIRVTPELVEVAGRGAPTTRWQHTFDADLTDVFRVQGEIATQVATALEVVLSGRERGRLAAPPTTNLEAYDAYLRGIEIERGGFDPTVQRRAESQHERAVALDPGFALAWARLASLRASLYANTVPTPELAAAALAAAERALALDPELAAGHRALGFYHRLVTKDPARALESFARGLALAPDDADLLAASALAERGLGRWQEALAHLERARTLDPRNWRSGLAEGIVLVYLRRSAEARAAFDRGLALAPENFSLLEEKAIAYLQEGDLEGARAEATAAERIDSSAALAYFASYWDLDWVLDERRRRALLALGPDAFDGDEGVWGIALAQAASRAGDAARVRELAERARAAFAAQIAEVPGDAQRHVFHGLALAYAGRCGEALAEGERGVALQPISADAYWGPYVEHQLARIETLCGERERAVARLERLLAVPYLLTPRWLAIDPNFAPLAGEPAFRRLLGD